MTETAALDPGLAVRRRRRLRMQALVSASLVLAVVPLTFLGQAYAGVQPSGIAWLLVALGVTPLVVVQPLSRRAVRLLAPYLAFLLLSLVSVGFSLSPIEGVQQTVQLAVPALVYLMAWRLPGDAVTRALAPAARILLGVAVALVVMELTVGQIGPISASTRPLAVALGMLVVLATLDAVRLRGVVIPGAVAVACAIMSGSRTASAIILVLVLMHPLIALDWRRRVALGLAAVMMVLLIAQTPAFKERFFFSADAGITDVFTLSENLNTAGRRELWPRLARDCAQTPILGHGAGSSYVLSLEYSGGAMPQPHNEPLRVFCDTGIVGSVLFWAFFVGLGVRAVRAGPSSPLSAAALQLLVALTGLGLTDNPIVYTGHFMAPAALVWGLADRQASGGSA